MCQTKNAGITQSVFFFEEMKATHICVKKYVFVKRCFSCCAWVPLNDSFPQSNVAHISFFRKNHIKMHPLCKEKIVHAFMYQRFVSHLLRMFSSFFQPFGVNPSTTKRCKNQLFPYASIRHHHVFCTNHMARHHIQHVLPCTHQIYAPIHQ